MTFLSSLRGDNRLHEIDGNRFYRALLVVDIDLDSGAVEPQPTWTKTHEVPGGVYSLLWQDGCAIGEMTTAGDPLDLLPTLLERARRNSPKLTRAARNAPTSSARSRGTARPLVGKRSMVAHGPSDVTVAICTRDRPDYVKDALRSTSQLSRPVAEVLVVDNASCDQTTREIVETFPFARYIREPRQGLDWARNRALIEARTPIVAFTDDDVIVHPQWIEGLLRGFREEPEAVVVTGLIVPAELATPAQVIFEGRGGFNRGFRVLRFPGSFTDDRHKSSVHVGTGLAGAGANMAVLRESAISLGGYDVALDVGTPSGGGGDLDMLLRTVAAGHVVRYEPTAVVRHRHRLSMEALAKQRYGEGAGTYSVFLGASRAYEQGVRTRLRVTAAWWLFKRHLRRALCSALWPDLWPRQLVAAEALGMLHATIRRYYARGRTQAERQHTIHPGEPMLGAPSSTADPALKRSP